MIQVVTIDGPAGAGKSSVARCLAGRLGWHFLDTGAMYRSVTLAAIRRGVDLHSDAALATLVDGMSVVVADGDVTLDGEVVTEAIRDPDVTRLTKHVADNPGVRRRLVDWQRRSAEVAGSVVAEGRDLGTIVFPQALRKFYLTADDEERARRRHRELASKGGGHSIEDTLRSVRDRDAGDRARSIAPMVAADDARVIDTTGLGFEQVVALIEQDIREHLAARR